MGTRVGSGATAGATARRMRPPRSLLNNTAAQEVPSESDDVEDEV